MDEVDITNALREQLSSMPDRPDVVWENQDATPTPPYLTFQMVRVPPTRHTLDGHHWFTGMAEVHVVTAGGGYAKQGEDIAKLIAAHFPVDTEFGGIRLGHRPAILDGYRDGPNWRTPVQIRYRLLSK